ncbi:hypothetical protein BC834DRAFT_847697 [Gloeopeniophorella convolvens]|nr:hypothetical protein BC834DRAFT_847697 [Gloeopeniophorella convolvens]
MVHYAEFIVSHGSAPRYNTEYPERLHIDFAKQAYRASNKRDYLEQMTRWLRRQEALQLRTSFLEWCHQELDPFGGTEVSGGALAAFSRWSTEKGSLLPSLSPKGIPARAFRVALKCPYPRTRADALAARYGADQFIAALNVFIRRTRTARSEAIQFTHHHMFPVYNKLTVAHLPTRFTREKLLTFSIHAIPSRPAAGRNPATPGEFDTVLLVDPEGDTGDRQIAGVDACLRVACVRALFTLPEHMGDDMRVLAYVELFTKLRSHDPHSGMYTVSPSTRQRRRNVMVVAVDDILFPCHLIPKSSAASSWPQRWSSNIEVVSGGGGALPALALFLVTPSTKNIVVTTSDARSTRGVKRVSSPEPDPPAKKHRVEHSPPPRLREAQDTGPVAGRSMWPAQYKYKPDMRDKGKSRAEPNDSDEDIIVPSISKKLLDRMCAFMKEVELGAAELLSKAAPLLLDCVRAPVRPRWIVQQLLVQIVFALDVKRGDPA